MKTRILITGADGFIGKNLRLALAPRSDVEVLPFGRQDDAGNLPALVRAADWVIHLAGVNRASGEEDFERGNAVLTEQLAQALSQVPATPVIYASSTQAGQDNVYGRSKRAAEAALQQARERTGLPTYIFRLTNVFGKWARPDYNSAVATFCHNIARDLPIAVHDEAAKLRLVYIDDVIAAFLKLVAREPAQHDAEGFCTVEPVYETTVGELAATIKSFAAVAASRMVGDVGIGLTRKLYATYVSYLPCERFSYPLAVHDDPRGRFMEFLRTPSAGQFSIFTAHPGVTRGGHYHHTKTEKFLVVSGTAEFGFRNMSTGESYRLRVNGARPEVVDTVPGWTHDISNVGTDLLVVALWANEVFDPSAPDTFAEPVGDVPAELAK